MTLRKEMRKRMTKGILKRVENDHVLKETNFERAETPPTSMIRREVRTGNGPNKYCQSQQYNADMVPTLSEPSGGQQIESLLNESTDEIHRRLRRSNESPIPKISSSNAPWSKNILGNGWDYSYTTEVGEDACGKFRPASRSRAVFNPEAKLNSDDIYSLSEALMTTSRENDQKWLKDCFRKNALENIPYMVGESDSPIIWESFFRKIEELDEDDENRLLLLQMRIKGVALDIFENYKHKNPHCNYHEVKKRLVNFLAPPETIDRATEKLRNLRRNCGETLLAFAMRIERTANQLRPYLFLTYEGLEKHKLSLFQRCLPENISMAIDMHHPDCAEFELYWTKAVEICHKFPSMEHRLRDVRGDVWCDEATCRVKSEGCSQEKSHTEAMGEWASELGIEEKTVSTRKSSNSISSDEKCNIYLDRNSISGLDADNSVSSNQLLYQKVNYGEHTEMALIDTESCLNTLSLECAQKWKLILKPSQSMIQCLDGRKLKSKGKININLQIKGILFPFQAECIDSNETIVIGIIFLQTNNIQVQVQNDQPLLKLSNPVNNFNIMKFNRDINNDKLNLYDDKFELNEYEKPYIVRRKKTKKVNCKSKWVLPRDKKFRSKVFKSTIINNKHKGSNNHIKRDKSQSLERQHRKYSNIEQTKTNNKMMNNEQINHVQNKNLISKEVGLAENSLGHKQNKPILFKSSKSQTVQKNSPMQNNRINLAYLIEPDLTNNKICKLEKKDRLKNARILKNSTNRFNNYNSLQNILPQSEQSFRTDNLNYLKARGMKLSNFKLNQLKKSNNTNLAHNWVENKRNNGKNTLKISDNFESEQKLRENHSNENKNNFNNQYKGLKMRLINKNKFSKHSSFHNTYGGTRNQFGADRNIYKRNVAPKIIMPVFVDQSAVGFNCLAIKDSWNKLKSKKLKWGDDHTKLSIFNRLVGRNNKLNDAGRNMGRILYSKNLKSQRPSERISNRTISYYNSGYNRQTKLMPGGQGFGTKIIRETTPSLMHNNILYSKLNSNTIFDPGTF